MFECLAMILKLFFTISLSANILFINFNKFDLKKYFLIKLKLANFVEIKLKLPYKFNEFSLV